MSETGMGVFIGVGDEIWNFLEFLSNFLELQRIPQRLIDVDESQRATSASRCAAAIAPLPPRHAIAPPPLSPACRPATAANAGESGAIAPAPARRRRRRPAGPSRLPLAPLSPLSGRQGGDTAPRWHQPKQIGTFHLKYILMVKTKQSF